MGFKDVLVWLRSHLVELIFLVLVVVLLAFLAWDATPRAKDFFEQRALKKDLAADIDTFYASVQAGRDKAMTEHQRVGVEVLPGGWSIYADTGNVAWRKDPQDELLSSGQWRPGLKFGSKLSGDRFFFTGEGQCHTDENAVCLAEEPVHPEKEVHVFSVTSDARRIYTLLFSADGMPGLVYDDF
jgi:Type II transport protein GspH